MSRQTHLIVGPGALGRLLAVSLADQVPVALLGRRQPPSTLTLTSPEGERRVRNILGLVAEDLPPELASVIHIATKAHAAESAFSAIADRVAPDTPLVLWQNGYGVQETLTHRWSGPVLCATTTEGAYIQGDDEVVHAGHGHTALGQLKGQHGELVARLADTLTDAGLPTTPVDDIRLRLWHKLAINAAINPLVARFRIRNGQLRDRPFRPMVEAVIVEVAVIMAAERIPEPPDGWHDLVWKVIEGTANNRASMLQDVLAGRPTEHDAILGPLLRAANRHGLPCPTLQGLYDALNAR
ncbi:2-dehydropantoate 2-reductase [Litchfieldella qijiaojingensis]|uniref:2-dehydropantoate 2-reductase n=1 Tax=Litchfieldella qijiaojingensis TaxID=980347 RepID=A0ABQ2YEI3_9GAMM|nr:2-dehydropantoate 2-reductase [Halomonas qijiaojingensis]GGX81000.1 2-dehydropantoate 2-reductase [Halomonas qijiaojingensis]